MAEDRGRPEEHKRRTYIDALLGAARDAASRFLGTDPETGETDYWRRGGLAGLLGMPSWDEQSPADIAMGFAGSTTPAVKGLLGAVAPTKGIRAYHGSPHDVDRFDLSKIGTGEGAQAYGHGLYFAENPRVAQDYRTTLAHKAPPPEEVAALSDEARATLMRLYDHPQGPERGAKVAQWQSSELRKYDLADLQDMAKKLAEAKKGRMYEVQINADPERFLDWDSTVQGPAVAAAAKKLGLPETAIYRRSDIPVPGIAEGPARGKDLYESAARFSGRTPAEASEAFRDLGVPGIKYLDQGSRAAGGGSRNFVVFDDKLIDILRKYGLLGPIIGGASATSPSIRAFLEGNET